MKLCTLLLGLFVGAAAGCAGADTIYSCTYETRYSQCGGGNYSPWETVCYEFDIDDYQDDWSPKRVCDKFTGTDLECAGGCCVYVEYQNNVLSEDGC